MPRIAPNGLLRPGLTVSLARYHPASHGGGSAVHLVARTPPAGRMQVSGSAWLCGPGPGPGPVRIRIPVLTGASASTCTVTCGTSAGSTSCGSAPGRTGHPPMTVPLRPRMCRWRAAAPWTGGRTRRGYCSARKGGPVVRSPSDSGAASTGAGAAADEATSGLPALRTTAAPRGGGGSALPVLPDAATWVLPDLALLRTGLIEADRLHPLVASALVPGRLPAGVPRIPEGGARQRVVECRGAQHRIGLVNDVLVPLDHDPAEIRREKLLAALTGTPLPCLRVIDEAHRDPECLVDVRAHLDHGDAAGALVAVEDLLGPGASLPRGALRDELEMAALRRIAHGLFRAGLTGLGQGPATRSDRRPSENRAHPRHVMSR
ncbi:hypothetical protein ACFQX6_53905 [Streptosporangium lutulentum]